MEQLNLPMWITVDPGNTSLIEEYSRKGYELVTIFYEPEVYTECVVERKPVYPVITTTTNINVSGYSYSPSHFEETQKEVRTVTNHPRMLMKLTKTGDLLFGKQ